MKIKENQFKTNQKKHNGNINEYKLTRKKTNHFDAFKAVKEQPSEQLLVRIDGFLDDEYLNEFIAMIDKTIKDMKKNPDKALEKFIATDHLLKLEEKLSLYKKLVNKDKVEKANKFFSALLKLSKTAYEAGGINVISDKLYDEILAEYLNRGNIEPFPKAITETKKKGNNKLQNNLHKAYIIFEDQDIPEGVAEKNSIENFLSDIDMADVKITPKIDGASVSAKIKKGVIVEALTRGDETDGSDIIHGLIGMKLYGKNDFPDMEVQYECFVTNDNMEKLTEITGTEYKSQRACVSGIIRRMCNDSETDKKYRDYISLYAIRVDAKLEDDASEFIQNLNHNCPDDMIPTQLILDQPKSAILGGLFDMYENMTEVRARLSYPIDGMVISILNEDLIESKGRKGRKNGYEIALKFKPESAYGIVDGYTLTTGLKLGKSIVINLRNPVVVDGRSFSNIYLPLSKFTDMKLCKGDLIEVVISGDVIPAISKVVKKNKDGEPLELPTICEDCGGALELNGGKLYCNNNECISNVIKTIQNFIEVIGVEGVSEKTVEKLVKDQNIGCLFKLVVALYNIEHPDEYKKLYNMIIDRIKESNQAIILKALGIRTLGIRKANVILDNISSINETAFNTKVLKNKLINISGIGESIIPVIDELTRNHNLIVILFKHCKPHKKVIINENTIKVATTNLSSDNKKLVKERCNELDNHLFVDSKSFDILIVEDRNVNTGKYNVAMKKGLPIYTVDEFINYEPSNNVVMVNEESSTDEVVNREQFDVHRGFSAIKWDLLAR